MLNVIAATMFIFLCLATALYMVATGSLIYAFIALFCVFIVFAISIASMFNSDF